jgi:hypothetical protein
MQSELSGSGKPPSYTAPASIAPVGLEAPPDTDSADGSLEGDLGPPRDRAAQTGSIRLPLRRRRLGGIVIATVGGCALLLVAAVIARVSHASSEPRNAPSIAKDGPASLVAAPHAEVAAAAAHGPIAAPAPAAPVAPASASSGATPESPTSGTVRVARPATPGRVWLDGKRLSAPSAVVMCGPHQVKVGASGRARSLQVPCGGELVISR